VQAEGGVAGQAPGGVAGQDVHLAGLERGEALLGAEGHPAHLVGVAEHGGGDGAADVHVEPAPLALAVGGGKPITPVLTPQASWPSGLDAVEGLAGVGRGEAGEGRGGGEGEGAESGMAGDVGKPEFVA
jgi:hypothetical protein